MSILNSAGATSSATPPPEALSPFGFGRNWQRYVKKHLTPQRERIAADSVTRLVGDLAGKTFFDVGSGSGLFSLAALRLGAARVVSFDVDEDSVASTMYLREREGAPERWAVRHGSVLDESFLRELGTADVVYSWGVLHHTGSMWQAIRNAAQLTAPGGTFAISIYNDGRTRLLTSARWLGIKRFYNRAPRPVQLAMEGAYLAYFFQGELRAGRRSPLATIRAYGANRGMAFMTDVTDWLGGYPYEYATVEQVTSFCESECQLGTVDVYPDESNGFSTNEFVFRRRQAS
jgi:2-polyprenyl-6-hydroxyphenyl methylase/3-demethylubiquinone-9 3-methyltransferase